MASLDEVLKNILGDHLTPKTDAIKAHNIIIQRVRTLCFK